MTLACVGISHHSAPSRMREETHFTEDEIRASLPNLKSLGVSECVLFSSKNRTELYTFSDEVDLLTDSLIYFLRQKKSLEEKVPVAHFFAWTGGAAVQHLFDLAAGIDSMIVGDDHVLSDIKTGLAIARRSGASGAVLTKLFDSALRAGEKVRSETAISEGAISVSHAAVELAEHIFDQLKRKKILVIGSGETVQQMTQHLMERGIGELFVTHSSADKADSVARLLRGMSVRFEAFREKLHIVDIVLASLQAAPFVLTKQDIKNIDRMRQRGTLLLIDLGMPRNIDPFATELEQVFLYDLDTLNLLVGENIARRRAEVSKAQTIIAGEVARLQRSGKPWNQFQRLPA